MRKSEKHESPESSEKVEMYSEEFLSEFEASKFYLQCKTKVEGRLSWYDWTECSVSCGGGFTFRMAKKCVPNYAICKDLPVLQDTCNVLDCPDMPSTFVPPGPDFFNF